jgi:pimeloyl-ACP methyl ester carboxylesterase
MTRTPARRGITALQLLLLLLATCAVVAAALYVRADQEHLALDAAARRTVGGQYVRLADGVTHFERTGPDTAPLVVLVHGFSVPMYIWDSTVVRLEAAGFQVLRYDSFGRGYSDRPRAAYDVSLFVRQIDQLLDSLRVTTPVRLVGLSMGGRVVAAYGAAHPERVRAVVLMDPAYTPTAGVALPLRLPVVGEFMFTVMAAPTLPASQATDFLHPEHFPDWADRYRPQMRYAGFRRAILSTIRWSGRGNDSALFAAFGARGIPTLLVWGREDQTVPFARSTDVLARIPQAQFVPVDSARHLPHMEQAAVTHRAIIDFLRSH